MNVGIKTNFKVNLVLFLFIGFCDNVENFLASELASWVRWILRFCISIMSGSNGHLLAIYSFFLRAICLSPETPSTLEPYQSLSTLVVYFLPGVSLTSCL